MPRVRPLLAAALLLAPSLSRAAAIDLHAHLLMDDAIPGLFRGEPGDEPAPVKGRTARFENQVSLKDLEAADVRLVVAALYAPFGLSQLEGGYTKALLAQMDELEAWAKKHPRVSIVRTPEEADAVLQSKEWRLGVVIGAEGSHAVDSPEKLDALFDRGLRVLTIAHFVDSPWAGAAEVDYWPRSSCRPDGAPDARRNPKGLTPLGETLVDRAVEKGLLLDLTHSSDRTALQLARRHPGLPLLFTHEAARRYTPCERAISPELLAEVKRSHGLVGVTFASNYVGEAMEGLVRHAKALAAGAGKESVAFGTDYNGLIRRVEGASDSAGYAAVLRELEKAGIPAGRGAEAFVSLWRRSLGYGLSAAGRRSPRPGRRRG